jgi:hypothetical protein
VTGGKREGEPFRREVTAPNVGRTPGGVLSGPATGVFGTRGPLVRQPAAGSVLGGTVSQHASGIGGALARPPNVSQFSGGVLSKHASGTPGALVRPPKVGQDHGGAVSGPASGGAVVGTGGALALQPPQPGIEQVRKQTALVARGPKADCSGGARAAAHDYQGALQLYLAKLCEPVHLSAESTPTVLLKSLNTRPFKCSLPIGPGFRFRSRCND